MTNCRECGTEIWFKKLDNGKTMPVNAEGHSHFMLCGELKTKITLAEGIPFEDSRGSGFIHNGRKDYFVMRGKTIVGENYHPKTHTCGVLPWESCNC